MTRNAHPFAGFVTVALVGVGGFTGSILRYLVGQAVPGLGGTLLVNALGSFVLGVVLYETLHVGLLSRETRVLVGTGFLASFTTYSTFALQTVQAPPPILVGNVVASYALGFGGVLVARALVRKLDGGGV